MKVYSDQPVRFVQHKMDGYFACLKTDDAGEGVMSLRRQLIPIPHKYIGLRLPRRTTLYGELYVPGVAATSVISHIKSNSGNLEFSPFAIESLGGKDTRELQIPEACEAIANLGFTPPILEDAWEEPKILNPAYYEKLALDLNIEGFVAKSNHYPMEGWYKIKPRKTVDCFVSGHTISESLTFFGRLRSFICSLTLDGVERQIAQVSSGLDHNFKQTCCAEDHYGRVMEVEYQSITPHGNLQFPRFVRWREDKIKEECINY